MNCPSVLFYYGFFSVTQQTNLGLARLTLEVSISHKDKRTYPVGLPYTSDQLVAEATGYKTHNNRKPRISMQ
jgi:hypothetical protein